MIKPFRWIGRQFSAKPADSDRGSHLETAKTTNENRDHWREASDKATPANISPEDRRTLRHRGKFETANNCYLQGMVRTLVRDTIGSGPRLQMMTDDNALNEGLEDLWRMWNVITGMPLNFRVMAGVNYIAGECMAVFRDSRRLNELGYPITLDVKLIDPAQCTDPLSLAYARTSGDEGIDVDDQDEPIAYHFLKKNAQSRFASFGMEADRIKSKNVLHWFRKDWAGQLRGITPIAPALDIFAQLRRFSQATLSAAEFAASIAGVLESDSPVSGADPVTKKQWFQTIEVVRGMLLTLPSGVKATGFDQKHPNTQYEMFVNMKLREAGRMLNIPFGIMVGDHSRYNYSSGRMDTAPYWGDREIERQEFEARIVDPVFYKFCDFARFALPALAAYKGSFWSLKHSWHYDARPSSDPVKDATGDELNLTNASDTLSAIAARDGTTAEAILQQRRRDLDLFDKYKLPHPPWAMGAPAPARQTSDAPAPAKEESLSV